MVVPMQIPVSEISLKLAKILDWQVHRLMPRSDITHIISSFWKFDRSHWLWPIRATIFPLCSYWSKGGLLPQFLELSQGIWKSGGQQNGLLHFQFLHCQQLHKQLQNTILCISTKGMTNSDECAQVLFGGIGCGGRDPRENQTRGVVMFDFKISVVTALLLFCSKIWLITSIGSVLRIPDTQSLSRKKWHISTKLGCFLDKYRVI